MKSTMTRLVSWLLVIAMLAGMPVMAMAEEGSGSSAAHYHACLEAGKGEMVRVDKECRKATCTAEGYDIYQCTACGYKERLNVVPAQHTYDYSLSPDDAEKYYHWPENGNAGYWLIPCTVKGCTNTMKVIDHDPQFVVAPLFDKDGKPVYETENGKVVKVNANGEKIAPDAPEYENGTPVQKTYQKPTNDWRNIHSLGEAEDMYRPATCVSSGYKCQKCTVPGCSYHTSLEPFGGPTGHEWVKDEVDENGEMNEWKVVKEPTGTAQGQKQRTCAKCGTVDTMPIPYLNPDKEDPETIYNDATVKYDVIYLYNAVDGSAVEVALKGSRFYIQEKTQDEKWYNIKDGNGQTWWVKASDMTQNAAVGTVPASAYAGAFYYGKVTGAGGIKVRAGASATSTIISSVAYETPFAVYEEKDGWLRIGATEEKWINGQEGIRTYLVRTGLKDYQGSDGNYYDINHPNYNKKETMEDPSGTVGAPDSVIATGTVNSFTPLNVRKEAKISVLNVIGSLARGTTVEIYQKTDVNGHDWGKIKYKNGYGWICLDYVTITNTTETNTVITNSPNATIVNVATKVNVRKEPNAKNPLNILGTLRLGTRVAVTKYEIVEGKYWYYADKKGWIFQDYIKLDDGVMDALKGGATGETPLTRYTNVSVPVTVRNNAEVKASPSAGAAKLMTVSASDDVVLTVTDRTKSGNTVWCKVTIGGVTGWIDRGNLDFLEITATVNGNDVKYYENDSVEAKVGGTIANGTKVTINYQTLDDTGTCVWGYFNADTALKESGYIQMHNLSNIAKAEEVTRKLSYISVSIPAKVNQGSTVELYEEDELNITSKVLLTLNGGREFTIHGLLDYKGYWGNNNNCAWGRVTIGSYTGWVNLGNYSNKLTDSAITQDSVSGSVVADSVNLYKIPYYATNNSAERTVERILRKGQKLTVLHRVAGDGNVWGMVRIDSENYWCNLSGTSLASQTVTNPSAPTTPTTPSTPTTPTTPTTPSVSTSAAGTIVCAKTVNIRKAAGVANPLVTTLPNGTKVTVYEQTTVDNALWGRIDQGWVAMEYVDLSTKPNVGTGTGVTGGNVTNTILTTVPSGSVAVGFVNTADLAVRSGAGQGYTKVTSLKKGTNVVIHEQQLKDGMIWGRIDQGWICTSYVTLTGIGNSGNGSAGIIKGCFYTANVRSAPGVGNALVGKVMVNSPVVIYEQKDYSGEMWGRTDIGWVAMQYVLIGSIPGI